MFCSVNSLIDQRYSRNRWNSILVKAQWNSVLTDTCSNCSLDCPVGQIFRVRTLSHLSTMMNTNFPRLKHCWLWINLNFFWTDCANRYFCFILIHFVELPSLKLCGTDLPWVKNFKYIRHTISNTLDGNQLWYEDQNC
jgi:hypothetical protein